MKTWTRVLASTLSLTAVAALVMVGSAAPAAQNPVSAESVSAPAAAAQADAIKSEPIETAAIETGVAQCVPRCPPLHVCAVLANGKAYCLPE